MVHEPPNGHSTRPKSNQHLGLLSGGQNPGVTWNVRINAKHPLSNGKKMEIIKTQTLLKIPSLRPSRFV